MHQKLQVCYAVICPLSGETDRLALWLKLLNFCRLVNHLANIGYTKPRLETNTTDAAIIGLVYRATENVL